MKKGKISLAALVLLSVTFFGGADAEADLGQVDYWNYSFDENAGEKVDVTEKVTSGEYARGLPGSQKLIIYGWGPNGANPTPHAISPIGIDPNKAYVLELRLEVDSTMPNDKDNAIAINYMAGLGDISYTPFDPNKRNFFMRQHPSSPSSHTDPNVYDLLDLTNNFTQNAQITLPDINSSTPRSPAIYDKWQKIVSNYADIQPSVADGNYPDGLVNFQDFARLGKHWKRTDCNSANKWCEYADLDRDGTVDYNDLDKSTEQWLVDANSIR